MQLQECLAEASGESRCGLCDAALCACQFCCESGQEVVLGLLGSQDGNGRQYAESVSGQEDYVVSCRACGYGVDIENDVVNVVDRIGDTGVLCDTLVCEVDLAVLVNSNVLKQSVALDGVVDVGLGLFVQVDNLCVAAALEVEDTVVIPLRCQATM
jgi:hypothetical protein